MLVKEFDWTRLQWNLRVSIVGNNEGGNIMPKMKTKKAAAKRLKVTGTGKLKRMKAYKSHILTKKSTKRKRNLRKATTVDATNLKTMKKILPYT